MIAGRTRFYVVAGIVGAILGELVAGALLIAIANVSAFDAMSRRPRVADSLFELVTVLLVMGALGGAWAGVAVMRRRYRRDGEEKRILSR